MPEDPLPLGDELDRWIHLLQWAHFATVRSSESEWRTTPWTGGNLQSLGVLFQEDAIVMPEDWEYAFFVVAR